ncbi:MAG: tetratricopeptide repeat protein [Saprospirales bacterium]|nr:tetratricopeptide repeat protein [Saprospirales bacterium]
MSNAQDDANYDAFLARQFLQNGEYAKAAEYYQELFNINPEEYYEDYINILLQLKDFDKAEKVTKLMYKQSENNPVYLLDLGGLYAKQNKEEDAIKQFNKTIKELKADRYSINEVALKFKNKSN